MSYDGLLKRLNIINAPTHDPNNDWLPVTDFLSRPPAAPGVVEPLTNVPLCPAEAAAARTQKMLRAQMLKDPSAPPPLTRSTFVSVRDAGVPVTRDPFEPPARYVAVENSSVINHSLVCPAPAFCTERCRMWSCSLWEQNEHEPLNDQHPMSLCRECLTILWLKRA